MTSSWWKRNWFAVACYLLTAGLVFASYPLGHSKHDADALRTARAFNRPEARVISRHQFWPVFTVNCERGAVAGFKLRDNQGGMLVCCPIWGECTIKVKE